MAKRRYEDDYEVVITIDKVGNEKKEVIYRGEYFEVSLDRLGVSQFKNICLLLLVAIITIHISGGFVGNQGMYQFYVALPYVFAFLPMIYLTVGVLRLPIEKQKYRRHEIGLSFNRVKTTSNILLILLCIGILGEILFILFFSADDKILPEYWYLALEILAVAANSLLVWMQRNIQIHNCNEQ